MQPIIFPPHQAPEQEAIGRARHQHISVHCIGKVARRDPSTPNLIAGSIITNTCIDDDGDQIGTPSRRNDGHGSRRRTSAFGIQQRGYRDGVVAGTIQKILERHVQRGRYAVEPGERNRTHAGFEPSDRLRCRGRIAPTGQLLKRQALCPPDIANAYV